MQNNIDLKQLEKKVNKDRFLDGTMDVIFGAIIINGTLAEWGFFTYKSFPLGSLLFFTPFIIAYYLINKYITRPRIGYAKFSIRTRPHLLRRTLIPSSIFIALMVVIGFMETGKLPWLKIPGFDYAAAIIGAAGIIVLFYLMSDYTGVKRFFGYGIGMGVCILISAPFTKSTGSETVEHLLFTALGIIMMITGVIIFLRFLKKYPLPPKEEPDAS